MTGELESLIVKSGQLDMEHGRRPAGKLERSGRVIIELEGFKAGDEWAEEVHWTADRELR